MKTRCNLLALAIGLVFPGAVTAEPPAYEIIDLGTLGGGSSVALGINNNGQVVGSADTPAGMRHAYIWDNGIMRDLGALPGHPQSEAMDVNNLAQVVGLSAVSPNSPSAFLWEEGTMIDLGHLTGTPTGDTVAAGINDSGQVVGHSRVSVFEVHAFLMGGRIAERPNDQFWGHGG